MYRACGPWHPFTRCAPRGKAQRPATFTALIKIYEGLIQRACGDCLAMLAQILFTGLGAMFYLDHTIAQAHIPLQVQTGNVTQVRRYESMKLNATMCYFAFPRRFNK